MSLWNSKSRVVLLGLTAAVLLSACAEGSLESGSASLADASLTGDLSSSPTISAAPSAERETVSRSELDPVTSTPAAALAAPEPEPSLSPETLAAIRDARSLRKAGNKARALGILEKTANADKDPALLLERGLLSLELGQIDNAVTLLKKAHNEKTPDWRQHSGLGAALSAQGHQQAAQSELAKALALSPDNPVVLNNLALSYALDGKHTEAERLLRQAASLDGGNGQAKQNLALIVGLRGNVDEAKRLSEAVLPPDKVKSNVAYLERLKTGGQQVSRADPPDPEEAHAVAEAANPAAASEPIMSLAQPN
jgi:Flp pilus assembly protein TadD